MRFFSKKRSENTKVSIFKALYYKAISFVVPKTQKRQRRLVSAQNVSYRHSLKSTAFLLLLLVGIGGLSAKFVFSQVDETDHIGSIKSTLLVYPTTVIQSAWSGQNEVLTSDLDEEALYQDFSAKNSAYVPQYENLIQKNQNGSQGQRLNAETNLVAPTENVVDTTLDDTSNIPNATSNDEDVQTENQNNEVEGAPVTLKKATESIFTFFETVTQLFPFAQETQVVPVLNTTSDVVQEQLQESVEENVPAPEVLVNEEAVGETTATSTDVPTLGASEENLAPDFENNNAAQQGEPTLSFVQETISLSDFSIPELKPGEFITNVQLRMSLGAQYEDHDSEVKPQIQISYKTPSSTNDIGSIVIEDEVSNALNGGYFLFALPEIISTQELHDIQIDVTYEGDVKKLDGVFIDAVWLEVSVESIDKDALQEQVLADTQSKLEDPTIHTLISEQVDFTRDELPKFSLKYNSQRNIAIRFLRDLFGRDLAEVEDVSFVHSDSGDIGATPQVDMTSEGLLTIQFEEGDLERLKPGEYTVELEVSEGGATYTDSFSFQWGLLSINSHKSVYVPNETAAVSLGSLSPNGNTVCDAELRLYIIDPNSNVYKSAVTPSGVCNGNNVIDVPDYSASFVPSIEGEYEMYLERIAIDGSILSHTSDTFLVTNVRPLSLERNGPSRIYPKATYPMEITVSGQEWAGQLIEVVPADFVITETDASITRKGNFQELSWDVSVDAVTSQTVSYVFDAPDISPFLYTLGKARLEGEDIEAIQKEVENVEVPVTDEEDVIVPSSETGAVSSATTSSQTENIESTTPAATTTEESLVTPSIEVEQTLLEKIIDFIPFLGEDDETSVPAIEVHENVLIEPVPMEQVVASDIEEFEVATTSESIVEVSTTSQAVELVTESKKATVVFEEYRKWQIASDATGSMIVYWTDGATIPSGWTCLSCGSGTFYQKFVRGGATYNSTGGTATHGHNASGTVNASAGANAEGGVSTFVSISSHSHTYTPTTTATSSLPSYRQLRAIQFNSAGEPASIPAGAIMMFDGTLPGGWIRNSNLDTRYPRGENTLSNGGSNTHRHTIGGSVDPATGTEYRSRTGGTQVNSAASGHTHTVSTTSAAVSIEPPFITVIFATTSTATGTPTSAIAMWTDTPPAQWQNQSANSGDPYFDKFIKGSATYGTTGGSETHTHANITGIISSGAVGTDNARTGTAGSSDVHTHLVDATSFTTSNNVPPYVTAIFGKKFGPIPLYTQTSFKWFVNPNNITPTDEWPVGAEDLLENETIDATKVPVKNTDVIRVRMQLSVSNSTSTSESFKLQYASTTALCSDATLWTDVGNATSSVAWRGYNNAGVADGATLSSTTLSGSDIFGSYEETNPSVTMPNTVGIGQQGEWDFVLQQNDAYEGATYCFRMVKSNGSLLFTYTEYPTLVTNEAPNPPTLTKLFDNEKVASTTPDFEFSASDNEANDLTYQIQVDDDYTFTSTNIDRNSVTNSTQFGNLATPADKDPFTQGERIFFDNTTALTNGTTYFWRVRAKDGVGSNTYGDWSTIRSFTVDTSVTLSAWFQSVEEQFDYSNTLDGVEGVASDQAQLKTGSTTGTMYSDPITFSEGQVGTAWGSFSFTDTEITSDLKYTIQYNNNDVWTDIPDSVLAGNVAGFDTSPVSLLGVDKTIYTELRIEANFVNSGATPSLQEWAVTWAYLIETPTISIPFANEKVSTTTPTFRFTTTDPQSDSLQYQIQWSTTYAFTASTTRNSNVNAGFSNLTTPADTDPFNSGNSIQFKIQGGDALTNGTTYWWRVRARDPLGANTYSFFTDPRSITVDTAVTVSTWFQTTQSQFGLDTLSNGYSRATDVVTVATTSITSLIAYAEGTVTTPRYRIWTGSVWGSESSALDVGATINWIVTKASPIESEYVTATLGTDADVNVQVFKNGSWGDLQEVTTSIPNVNMRGFDVSYEQTSGDAMVVTCDGDADPTYYIWNGSSWTNGGAIGLTGGNTCGWVRLISDPISDEIIAITRDTSGITYEARVWTGSAWGNSVTWGSMVTADANDEGIAGAYEESGGQAIVAVSNGGAASFVWRSWNGSSWTASTAQTIGNDFEWGTIVSDDGSDNMAICYLDQDSDIGAVRWTGAAWAGQIELETTGNSKTARAVDCAFEVGGARDGRIMVAYSDTANLRYRSWDGATWAAEASIPAATIIQDASTVQLQRTGANLLQVVAYDDVNDRYDYSSWNGTTWSAFQTLETDASVGAAPFKEPFMNAVANPAIIGTVVGNPLINFYEGSGPYWQQLSWNDTEGGGSTILYQMEYYDGDSWELIPDSLIPGNSTGDGTSPTDLTGVLPASTYDEIRPVANMTCNLGTCPSLSDWTVTWAAGITISGTAQQYNQASNVTSGTVAVALNGTVQVGKTGTIAAGVWSIANVNAAPGDIVTVFITGATDSTEAVGVTKYDGVGNISGINLYERHLSIGSDDVATITNANLALYDFTNVEDVFFDVNASNDLSLCATTGCGDAELIIKANNIFQSGSGGDVTVHDIENNGTLRLNGNTLRLNGSWDNNATTSSATSTVIFTATSTSETLNQTDSLSPSFYNLSFGASTSTANWTLDSALDVNNNLTVSGGTFARASNAITLGGNLVNSLNGIWTGIGTTTFDGALASTWSDASVALQNIGRVVIDGSNKSVTLGNNAKARSIIIGSDDTFDASPTGYSVTVFRDWTNNNTFNSRTGTVIFAATTTGRIITAGGDAFYNTTFNGSGGAWSFTENTLGINNDFTITTGTVTLPTATTTIVGSFSNAGTFVHNNGQLYFTSASAETLTLAGTPFTNAFYNARFTGSGSWSFTESNATTSNLFRITQGNVTLPSGTLTIGDTFTNSAGTFTHNSGTIKFINTGTKVVDTNSSFNSLRFTGSGSAFSFLDSSVTLLGSLTVSAGTLTLPSATMTIGGSLTNAATLTHNSGTVLFNSTDTGEFVNLGNSSLFNMTFSSATGGWTISENATTTNNTTLTSASSFTLTSGKKLSVGATFTNSVGGAQTTWTGSTLSLEAGNYSINTKTTGGDVYDILRVDLNTDIKMWNSSASTYTVDATGSLYSQDHSAVDGDLYIFGNYPRTSGTEYWSSATDFDGVSLGVASRQVDVRFAAGASASFSASTLSVVGSSTATTTVANQGSGTYTIGVASGTTTATYYSFVNLGTTGLSLTASNKVTSLAYGVFNPGIGGGTGITVSSSTIDRNPALQILNVNFSTTSAIAATNVTQTGGTPASYWWFRNSSGNIDGESKDSDTGNPGSIRWDDSSLVFTVSGRVYADDGTTPLVGGTCNGVATPVRVKVEGGGTFDGTCSAVDGTYSIPGVTAVGDPTITVFLNGASGGQKAVLVTKTPTSDITGMDLYVNRVIVRHQDVSPMSIADMASFDSTDDADIAFTAATGTSPILTVLPNTELFVWATTTFTPGGTVTVRSSGSGTTYDGSLHIDNGATFTGAGTTTYSIGGSYIQDSGATFTPASSTVLMTATTSGKTILVATGRTATFNLLNFTGVNGGWNLNGNMSSAGGIHIATGTVTGTGNVAVLNGSLYGNGTLSLGSGTTTISKTNTLGGTRAWTFSSLTLGNGVVVGTTTPASSATTTISGKLTIAVGHYLKANSSVFNLSGTGTVFVETGTFVQDSSTVRYSGTGATNILSTSYYNLEVNALAGSPTFTTVGLGVVVQNNLSLGGGATTTLNVTTNDTPLDVDGNITIASNGTFIASNSGLLNVGGSWDNNGTFTHSSGSITFDGAGTPTIDAGTSWFYNVTVNGTGSFTVSPHATSSGAFSLTGATSFTLGSGQVLAIGGTFTNSVGGGATTWTGSTLRLYSGTNFQMNTKTIADAYNVISVGSNTDVRMWNSSATTYTVSSSGSLYSQDHNDVPGDLYVYGNYVGNGTTDHWSYATDFDGVALGGSSRQVDVRFISGASMELTSGGLSVRGITSASTSIQNQGSGTYGLRVGGTASTSWSYYDVEDTNASGLVLSGTANVVSLSYGDVEVSQGGGSAITIGGSVINANPAKTFTNNTFSTTTGVAGFNVTATGTAVSSWRFTNHAGTIDGEARDVDPDGDPGYVVWDDSAASVTISGNVYSDEGVTVSAACDGVTNNIHLRIAGLTSYTTSCNAGTGFYSIPSIVFSPGDSLIVYIDGETEKGATVSEDIFSSIGNMHIYENRVIVRHEDTNPLSISDMAVWDSSDDADIPFTAVDAGTDTLTLPANRKLLVWTGKTFTPGGNITLSGGGGGAAYDGTLEAQTSSGLVFTGSEQHSIGGSFIFGSGATFTSGLSTTTFTTTGSARTIDVNNQAFYNTAFTGSGSWSVTDATLSVRSAQLTAGTLTLPTGTTTISGSWNTNGGAFVNNNSTFLFTSTATGNIVRGGTSNFEEMIFRGTGGSWSMIDTNATATAAFTVASGTVSLPSGLFSVGGSFRNVGGTITHNTSEVIMRSSVAATIKARGSDLFALTISGTGPFTMSDGSLALLDDFKVTTGSITLATSTLSVGGSFLITGGTFAHASGTVLFNATATGKTVNPNLSPFYSVVFGSATGGWTVSASATTTRNFTISSASSFTLASGMRLSVGNVFTNSVGGSQTTWTGSTLVLPSQSEYAINTKTTGGDYYQTLIVGSNTDISSWNSRATTTTVSASGSFYSQDHANVNGALFIYGDYHISTSTKYWSYATDFDGVPLGGSPRTVTVSLASNATTTVDGGSLQVVGILGSETTLQNQGSGSYAFRVNGGVFNALYYDFRNLNSAGLRFTGAPSISSLSYGDFELAVSNGSLITLASTTLDANASMVITGNRFATTTAITGKNVTLIGSTSNAWSFISHTGNLDGEVYDVDGASACGSIRWNDSSCLLTQQTHYRWRNDDGAIGVPNTEWFNGNWNARQKVRVENTDATTYTNAVVKIQIPYDGDMQTDFDDLRFTTSNGTTTLSYFVDRYTASTDADVWVKIPSLTALDTTTLFMYYNNATASSTGSSTSTFIAADDFEDGNKTEYSGDTSLFVVDGTFAYGGSYGIDATGNENSRVTDGIGRTDITVGQGQIVRYLQYVDVDATGDDSCTLFGVQSPVTSNLNYAVCLTRYGTDSLTLAKNVFDIGSSGTVLSSSTVAFDTAAAWYEVEIDWNGSNLSVELSQDGALLATTSATDSTYTSGGIGFSYWFQHGGWDNVTSRTRVATEPTVRFGAEQVDGGASWKGSIDVASTYIANDIARLRLSVENTGLQITNQTFDLEFAEKGAAPSCEAVSGASYAIVPPQASCGSSPICMQASSFITNGASAADLLFGPEIDYTLGEVIESPSNTSDSLTLDQNEYTELEYAVTPTVNATEPAYCFRVTDASDPLDTYLKVAEMQLQFDPVVTNVSLNGGQPITLLPGATTTVYATGTVTDLNGYADLNLASSTMYRSGVAGGAACSSNTNNCYIARGAPMCTFTNCAGSSCDVSCRADFYYHADATDVGGGFPGETWEATIEVSDQNGVIDIGNAISVELYSLRALDLVSSSIGYGSLSPASTTGAFNPTTTIRSLSNVPIDISIQGTDLTDGLSSTIPVYEQIFATSTFTYTGCVTCSILSSSTPIALELDLSKPTSTSTAVTDIVYWGIEIPPLGIAGNPHTGTNIFYATVD